MGGATRCGFVCRTLFEALQESAMQTALLTVQYRMHPAIAEFCSAEFYGGRIVTGSSPASVPAHCKRCACSVFLHCK